jgi:Tfp pilus assembly protein PilF
MSWWTRLLGYEADRSSTARAIRFDTEGWRSVKAQGDGLEWRDALGNRLRVCFHMKPVEHLAEAVDIGSLRAFCRRKSEAGGGAIVSVETIGIAGIRCLMAIDKYERRPACDYVGAITIPLADSHFEIVMNAREHGITGVREAVVINHLLKRGELDLSALTSAESEVVPIPGWCHDPYDPGYDGRVLYSLSDDARLDALFPDHPLSRIRCSFARIQPSLEFDASVSITSAPRFHVDDAVWTAPAASRISAKAMGSLYLKAGRYDEVENVITESLRQLERSSDADPMAVARESLLVGFAYENQGKLKYAETAFRRASASFEVVLGENHPNTAHAINNLAHALIAQGKHEEAEPLFRRVLRVFETAVESSSDAGVALNGLGLVYNARGLYAEAIPCFERALAIFERVHGPTFPDVATVLRNMAFSWKRLGNTERMVEAWERAERVDRGQRRVDRTRRPVPRRPPRA